MKWRNILTKRLKELGYNSYQDYLRSPHWQDVRKRFYASGLYRNNPWCICCKNPNIPLQVHHKTYKRLGKEHLNDLVAICGECHKSSHNLVGITTRTNLWNSFKKVRKAHRKPNCKWASAIHEHFTREGHFIKMDGRLIYSP